MELNTLGDLIRDDEPAGPSAETVDRLVTGALRRGRRTRIGRRVAAGVAGCVLLLTGAAVVGQWPGRALNSGPVGPTATMSASPSIKPNNDRPPTYIDVMNVYETLLGQDFRYSGITNAGELPGQVSVTFTATDSAGRAWMGGGVDNEMAAEVVEECDPETCTRETLAGGTLTTTWSPPGDKVGDDRWYSFERPDGRWAWFGQANHFEGNGPVTRPEVPLTDAQVRALLTAPEWDALVERCAAASLNC